LTIIAVLEISKQFGQLANGYVAVYQMNSIEISFFYAVIYDPSRSNCEVLPQNSVGNQYLYMPNAIFTSEVISARLSFTR